MGEPTEKADYQTYKERLKEFLEELKSDIGYDDFVALAEKHGFKISKTFRGENFKPTPGARASRLAAKYEIWFSAYDGHSSKTGLGNTLEEAIKDAILELGSGNI